MMDPITLILTALAAGATRMSKGVGGQALKDSYASLKILLQRKLEGNPLVQGLLEENEKSPEETKPLLRKYLVEANADKDKELLKQAQMLNELIQNQPTSPGDQAATALSNHGVDFVLVTALEEERDAVLDKLPGYRKLPPSIDDIRTYFWGELPVTFSDGGTGTYRVIVMPLLGMGRVQAAAATKDAITQWHPRYVVLVGIGGGMAAQGVSIGDILIADQIVDYELQKLTPQGPQVRWEVHRTDPRLLSACHNFIGESWQDLVRLRRPTRSNLKRHTGPIASGDKVIAFGDVLEKYREVWPRLVGVEMEAAGVATATFQSAEAPGFLTVRCVSDLADEQKDSADIEKWRSYACEAAASFAIALLRSGPVSLQNENLTNTEPPSAGRRPRMLHPTITAPLSDYDLQALYELLFAAFSDEEVVTLAFGRFYAVYEDFSPGMSKSDKIRRLIEWCKHNDQIETLLSEIKRCRPLQYQRYSQRLKHL
jgi:nucleoside phosphorylase